MAIRTSTLALWCLISGLISTHQIEAVSKVRDFYQYGPQAGDEVLPYLEAGDSNSREIIFSRPAYFFGHPYSSAYVSENGLITFETDVQVFADKDIREFEYSLIAAFYADIDIRNYDNPQQPHGKIYYRITEDRHLRERASRYIQSKFSDVQHDFEAKWLLIVTWDEVGYNDGQYDKKNTFQAALIAGETHSYVDLLYADDGIQWIRAAARQYRPAQVGFVSDDGHVKALEHSGTEHIAQINRRSNVNEPGRYLFRVSGQEIVAPSDVQSRTQPLDIGGPGGVVGAGMHSSDLGHDEVEDDENDEEYDVYNHREDGDVNYEYGPTGHDGGQRSGGPHNPVEPARTPSYPPLAPAPPAPGPEENQHVDVATPQRVDEPEIRTPPPVPDPTHPTMIIEEDDDNDDHSGPDYQQPNPEPPPVFPREPGHHPSPAPQTEDRTHERNPHPQQPHREPPPLPTEPQIDYWTQTPAIQHQPPPHHQPYPQPVATQPPHNPYPEYQTPYPYPQPVPTQPQSNHNQQPPHHPYPDQTHHQNPHPQPQPIPTQPQVDYRPQTPAVPYDPRPAPPGLKCDQGGQRYCHANADCRDYSTGSCCQCRPGQMGNGRECLKEGEAQRINGRFYGRINNVDIPETELHTYVVTSDGRTYTALSSIPHGLGRSLLLLGTVGGVMGWMFAKPTSSNSYNGFMLTGGHLNRTATVHISDRFTVTIQQEFSGKDMFNYLKAKVYVTGTLPEVPDGVEMDYGEYKEEYTRHSPGVIKSYSTKLVAAGSERYQMVIDQTIRFEDCPYQPFEKEATTVLRVDRSYNVYDPNEQIVRYAAANMIETPSDAGNDPCREGNHDCVGPHMSCARDGRAFRCTCVDGYELTYPTADRRGVCVDLDECTRALHRCDAEADCFNREGGYQCICRPGFSGDGHECTREIECGSVICDQHAECLPAESTQLPECVCRPGYRGDGLTCHPMQTLTTTGDEEQPRQTCADLRCHRDADCRQTAHGYLECVCKPGFRGDGHQCTEEHREVIGPQCTDHNQCHRYGRCLHNPAIHQYQCQCIPPYSGDGRHCFLEAESCDKAHNCDPNADCLWTQTEIGAGHQCKCRPGFSGDGKRCTPIENPQDVQCNVVNNCHPHARCDYDSSINRYKCKCLPDYEGDGSTCQPKHTKPHTGVRRCQSVEDCHPYAACINRDTHQDYICECLPGFKGDGVATCEPADQCVPETLSTNSNQCDVNAACIYDDVERAYVCKCKDGYQGDGKTCRSATATCDRNPNLCHPNAQCTWDGARGSVCQCKTGFRGDGVHNCDPERISCDVQNNCHSHAQCQRNRAGEHRCVCNAGYEGDGLTCRPSADCLVNANLCDANAMCISDNFRYVCRCKPGYHGSGQTCSADSELRGRTLAFTQGVAIVQRGLLPDDLGKQIVVVPHQIAVGLDYDCQDDKLFWTDVSGHAIRSAYTDGSNLTTLFSDGLSSPEGLVVDWASKNVYYTDSQLDIIGVARQDGKYRTALIKEGLVNPRALALDLHERKLYYSDWYRQKPIIGRLNLDGTGREDFVSTEIALPNGLVILNRRRQLCWADAGMQRLECIGLNGGGRRVIYAPLGYPFGLAVHNEETFYWTDWEDLKIHSVSINGGNHHAFIPSVGGSGKLYGIVMLPDKCPTGDSPCAVNNGGCPFICLPDRRGLHSCVCPDNIPESECNKVNGS